MTLTRTDRRAGPRRPSHHNQRPAPDRTGPHRTAPDRLDRPGALGTAARRQHSLVAVECASNMFHVILTAAQQRLQWWQLLQRLQLQARPGACLSLPPIIILPDPTRQIMIGRKVSRMLLGTNTSTFVK